MRKIYVLFALVLTCVGVTQVKAADPVTESFEDLTVNSDNMGLSNGWVVVGSGNYAGITTGTTKDFQLKSGYAKTGSYSVGSQYSCSSWMVCPVEVTGDVTFYARRYSNSYAFKVATATKNGDSYTVNTSAAKSYTLTTTHQQFTFTVGEEPLYVAFQSGYSFFDDVTYTPYEVADGPGFAVADFNDGDTYAFGLVVAGTTKAFTLKNPGTEEVTVAVTAEGGYTVDNASVSIAAGGQQTVTVTVPEATSAGAVTFTPNAEGLTPVTVNLSSVIRDPNKMFVDFADGAMPDDWQNVMIGSYGSGWVVNSGYVSHSSSASSYYLAALTSPKVTFTANEPFRFDVARYGSVTYNTSTITLQTSADGETWTDVYTVPADQLVYGEWKTQTVNMAAGTYYVRFYGGYAHITNIYGGELPLEAKMKVTAADHSFGMITEAASTTFTIANSGRAELAGISVASDNAAFTIEGAPATLEAGAEATVTVTMAADSKGLQNGVITVSATGQETVTFNVKGYVADEDKLFITFDDNKAPENWTNTGWTFANGVATGAYTSSTTSRNAEIVTPAIEVAEGETMAIEAKGNSSSAELRVYTSADNGSTWTNVGTFNTEMRASTSDYTIAVVSGIEAGSYLFKFEGYSVSVNAINGFNYDLNAPALAVTPAEDAAFGKVTESASKTYTVANTGTGEMTVNIASDSDDFTVEPAQLVVNGGEEATFTVTFNYTEGNYGEKSATITVMPTYNEDAAVTINATANAKDPNVWEEDFENGIPSTWTNNGWTISRTWSEENTVNHAYAGTSNDNTLVTPRLFATEGQVLQFEVIDAETSYPLHVEWSHDGDNWTSADDITESGTQQFIAPGEGTYYLRFSGRYIYLDDFYGFKLDLLTADAAITASSLPATGQQYVEYAASVTVQNKGTEAQTAVARLYVNDEVVAEEEAELAVDAIATIDLTFTPDEALEDAATKIEVTLKDVEEFEAKTVEGTLTIAAAPALDETVGTLDGFENWGNYPVVTLNYSLKAGWNTIVLPFAVSDLSVFGDDVQAYAFSGYTDGELKFSPVTELNVQQPYLLKAAEAKSEIKFTDVTSFRTGTDAADMRTTQGDAVFQGTYAPLAAGEMEGKYGVVANGDFKKGSAKATMKGFRAYFELPTDAASVSVSVIDNNGEVTRISGVELEEMIGGQIYDLSGRKVNVRSLMPGIYVRDGKKFIVK